MWWPPRPLPSAFALSGLRLRLFGHAMAIARMGLFSEIAVYFKDLGFGLVRNYANDMKWIRYLGG